jgi:hypothetical protein
MAVLACVLIVWLGYAVYNHDPLWFVESRKPFYEPERIFLRYYGTPEELQADSEAFQQVSASLNQSLSSFRGRGSVGLSEATLRDYRETAYVLELHFSKDIAPVGGVSSPINQFMIPINGRHSGNGYVFVGYNDEWLAAPLIMGDPRSILAILDKLGYGVK